MFATANGKSYFWQYPINLDYLKQQPIHVLFLPKWYPNKLDHFDGNFVENHAHAVSEVAKVSVIFVHSEEKKENEFTLFQSVNQEVNEIRVFFKKPDSGPSIIRKIVTMIRYFKAQLLGYKYLVKHSSRPNIAHIHVLTRTVFLALYLKFTLKIPYVITEHWSGYLPVNGGYRGFIKKIATEIAVKYSNGISSVSAQLKAAMLNHKLVGEYRIIPNVVDTKLFKPTKKSNTLIEIIFVGNLLQSPKRIFDIIKSMKVLHDKKIAFQLSIYGEGKDKSACEQLISKLALKDSIKLKGTLKRKGIAEVMGKSDFLVLFSEFENQPCVLNEAMSCGIPVIAPDIPGIAERLTPEVGIMIPTGDISAFESALVQMCHSFNDYDTDKIRSMAIEQFSEEVIGNQFLEFYNLALNK